MANAIKTKKGNEFVSVEVIRARVPIVKCLHQESNIAVDIAAPEGGCDRTEHAQGLLKEYPLARPLTVIIKHFLFLRGLNDVFTGGLGSYSILLLVVGFLQRQQIGSKGQTSLGTLLVQLLALYGKDFYPFAVSIDIRAGGGFKPKTVRMTENQGTRPFLLYLVDPLAESSTYPPNNVAGGTFGIARIRRAFEHAYHCLT
eukprot:gene1608-12691_t